MSIRDMPHHPVVRMFANELAPAVV